MYAVIKAGGHQYRVKEGDVITVDKILGNVGDSVNFDKVLMLSKLEGADVIGTPLVADASVQAVIKEQKRAPKVIIFRYRRRKNSKKKRGAKQPITVVEISKIQAN
jgi:large subunit ribosomal protein L21